MKPDRERRDFLRESVIDFLQDYPYGLSCSQRDADKYRHLIPGNPSRKELSAVFFWLVNSRLATHTQKIRLRL
ncbi:hypothetical protein [Rivibacter subsaxonicus]|uniref:Uncharacterized protein n=1 Tax=Rivibacter subsaxonicus TaxID=457575 RepID=A0A4Q7VGZ5_9BURK|nr:hypothetical protein [Rivibacter subsaxonicus]RZT95297.1 hypothetical protein EV670_3050 [Rivibacter subsaxonicus]